MEDPIRQDSHTNLTLRKYQNLPPTPPYTEDNESNQSDENDDDVQIPLPPPTTVPTETLEADKKTPDAHVARDARLIRLTGVHPFNVEAPLTALFNEGFLTTPELFYVRNHGAVPQVLDHQVPDWEFSIEGLVEKPISITLRQLIAEYEQITCPISLVCAGNRRKEQNQVKKSKGFSWGPAGVSNALWTGVAMSELIRRAKPKKKARYLCMEGADKLPNGYYGTSVKLNWALDPNRGMMLAHSMNGEMLRPDHGRPLRAVIPGQIGGRSVKWLKRIILSAAPSDNWYHLYDNRVLPTMVSPEESANNKDWWIDERYAIYDLSVNSATAYPAHEERLSVSPTDRPITYKAKGYAYSGGGRRVTRVELSLDKGRSWRLASIMYPEDRYREAGDQQVFGGRLDMSWRESSFCWCLWELDIPVDDLVDASDLVVRAMDESMQIQPRDMYWNVLGMMNNPWFRITITKEDQCLRFEHPTQPALQPGGWMERVKKAGGDLSNGRWGERAEGEKVQEVPQEAKEVVMTKAGLKREITIDELRKHDNEQNPWFVLNGHVYEGLTFMNEHPGGAQSIISAAGLDSSDEFMAIHSETAKSMMPKYHIGTLDAAAVTALANPEPDRIASAELRPTFLQSRSWTTAPLVAKKRISSDTIIFTFKLQHDEQTLGLPVGQHIMIRLRDPVSREAIIRSYTPISSISQRGTFDVLVKLYLANPNDPANSREGGKMSTALSTIPIGHGVDFKGPIGKFEYTGRGTLKLQGQERHVRRFAMICAGSGITPIFQVFRAVMQDAEDPTRCTVINGNRLVEDILCREDLESLLKGNEHRAEVVYTLTRPPEKGWEGLRGRIDKELIRRRCTRDCDEDGDGGGTMILVCGPEALEKAVHQALREQGWKDDQIVFF